MEDLFDLIDKRQELKDKLDEIGSQIHDIDKKIELFKKEHADELFEYIKPLLKNLEELGYYTKFERGKSFRDSYTNSYYTTEKDKYFCCCQPLEKEYVSLNKDKTKAYCKCCGNLRIMSNYEINLDNL